MQDKKELRKIAKKIRSSLDIKTISDGIVEQIKQCETYQNAQNIMIFYPLGHEVNLLGLLNDKKNFYLPKVDGENLLVCPYKSGDELTLSSFKTEEPITKPVSPEILDLVFVPALMVDRHNRRLGYGGGFYDKFLSKNALISKKIVAIPSALLVENLPSEAFDVKIDITICEKLL